MLFYFLFFNSGLGDVMRGPLRWVELSSTGLNPRWLVNVLLMRHNSIQQCVGNTQKLTQHLADAAKSMCRSSTSTSCSALDCSLVPVEKYSELLNTFKATVAILHSIIPHSGHWWFQPFWSHSKTNPMEHHQPERLQKAYLAIRLATKLSMLLNSVLGLLMTICCTSLLVFTYSETGPL